MNKELTNLFIFLAVVFLSYLLFKNLNWNGKNRKEGMTDASGNTISTTSTNGIAGNADGYGATIKAETIKLQDTFLISKYRKQYETVILDLDDLVDNLMLQTVLSINKDKPAESFAKLVQLNQSKSALNNVMKFVDKSS